ncbi:MAG: hypothetical protein CLLPBCKN_006780 [Chroococcidiopsis cubana SAG 39.79]|nr:hypothetical protein [Chroococcidiopsis cubana SAG 39.79]
MCGGTVATPYPNWRVSNSASITEARQCLGCRVMSQSRQGRSNQVSCQKAPLQVLIQKTEREYNPNSCRLFFPLLV